MATDWLQNTERWADYVAEKPCTPPSLDFSGVDVSAVYLNRRADTRQQTGDHKARARSILESANPSSLRWREW